MNQPCIACQKVFWGRSDKKYCSDKCRFAANNQKQKESPPARWISTINRTLKKNRQIMQFFNPVGKTTLEKKYLVEQGFDFNYFTHQYKTPRGSTYHFCYEYGYLLLPAEKVLLVIWQPPLVEP